MDANSIEMELSASPTEEDIRVLSEGLERFNRASALGGDRSKVPIAVWMRRDGRVVGGAYGDTHYG
jgi:hypothetical protein